MNTREVNKLAMGLTVQTICHNYSDTIAQIPAFVFFKLLAILSLENNKTNA
jgi:hypothetical protein